MKKYWVYLGEHGSPPLGKLLLRGNVLGEYYQLCDPHTEYSWIVKERELVTWVLVNK